MRKVEEWLPEVERSQERKQWDLHLQATWNLPHIKRNSLLGNFAVSDSGTIAVVGGGLDMSSLILMKPDQAGTFNIQMLEESYYCSADFITIKGEEYLAASLSDSSIRLYDVEKGTWKEVFKLKDTRPNPKTTKLCVLGGEAVAFAEREPSEDGIHKIYILDASKDPDEWTVGGHCSREGAEGNLEHVLPAIMAFSLLSRPVQLSRSMRTSCPRSRWAGSLEV